MKRMFSAHNKKGFTLVELLIAMFLTFVAAAGMYKMLVSYNASSETMDQLVELQQNCRIAMGRMTEEIRMAGFDPTTGSGAKIYPTSNATRFTFSLDDNEDGDILDAGERITYSYDAANQALVRNDINGSGEQQVITNVNALEFLYFNKDGNSVAPGSLVRTVEIAMVVRTTNEDFRHVDNSIYQTRRGVGTGAILYTGPGDNFRRRLVEQTVQCRNSGL